MGMGATGKEGWGASAVAVAGVGDGVRVVGGAGGDLGGVVPWWEGGDLAWVQVGWGVWLLVPLGHCPRPPCCLLQCWCWVSGGAFLAACGRAVERP